MLYADDDLARELLAVPEYQDPAGAGCCGFN